MEPKSISSAAWSLILRSRQDWGAEPGKPDMEPMQALKHPIPKIRYIHNTGTPRCANDEECVKIVRELQNKHLAEGLGDIRYNFLVGDEGVVYEGRGWHVKPPRDEAHADKDGTYLEIALIGDLSWETEKYSWMISPMCDGQWELISEGMEEKYIDENFEYIPMDPKTERPQQAKKFEHGKRRQDKERQRQLQMKMRQEKQERLDSIKRLKEEGQQQSSKIQEQVRKKQSKGGAKEVKQRKAQIDSSKEISGSNKVEITTKNEPARPFVGPNMSFDVQSGRPFEIPKQPDSPVKSSEASESEDQSDSPLEKPTKRPKEPLKPPETKPSDEPLKKTPDMPPTPPEIPEAFPMERPLSSPTEMPSKRLEESTETSPVEFPGRPFKRPDDQPEERPERHPSEYPTSVPIERQSTNTPEMPRKPSEYTSTKPLEYTNKPF